MAKGRGKGGGKRKITHGHLSLSVDISVIFGARGLMDLLFSDPICLPVVVGFFFPTNVFATRWQHHHDE
jgi:hypothetical protein